jgi:hypothetical protein
MSSVVAYLGPPNPVTLELLAMPVLFLVLFVLTLLAGLPWRAGLAATGVLMALWIVEQAARSGGDVSPPMAIGAAVAAMLLIVFCKLRGRKA